MKAMTCCCPFGRFARRRVSSQKTCAKMQPLGDVITDSGLVRYHLLFQDDTILQDDLEAVRTHPALGEIKEKNPEDLAFYCNAYNLWSMNLAAKRLEKSDKRWKGNVNLLERARFFKFAQIVVAGKKTNLYALENSVIRKYEDPRIHFAINCSSMSCPPLPNFLFSGQQLNEQLETQTRRFINEAGGVKLNAEAKTVELSSIFKWYAADFNASTHGSITAFVNHYLQEGQITEEMKVSYMAYDWSVNWAMRQ